MIVIEARNVQEAICHGAYYLREQAVLSPSRYGSVRVIPCPVTTVYKKPWERVVYWRCRDAHPFFHLMESLWMLSGGRDVEFPSYFVSRMKTFSDDGMSYRAAYGHRWRHHFDMDQLDHASTLLREHPKSRRAAVVMWDPKWDLHCHEIFKDIPCNMACTFQLNPDTDNLDMTVFCRSNDVVWGAYGANAVHLSMLHEYMAAKAGMNQGVYYQISNNYHAYTETFDKIVELSGFVDKMAWTHTLPCPYREGRVMSYPLVDNPDTFDADLAAFMKDPRTQKDYSNSFFDFVAVPMYLTFVAYKEKDNPDRFNIAKMCAREIYASDWKLAAVEWLERREAEVELKKNG